MLSSLSGVPLATHRLPVVPMAHRTYSRPLVPEITPNRVSSVATTTLPVPALLNWAGITGRAMYLLEFLMKHIGPLLRRV